MAEEQTKSPAAPASADASSGKLALEDVLIALQKSFSRVSNSSRDVPPEAARALISGPVSFELSIRLTPTMDRLLHKTDGDLQLKLNGTLRPDIRVRHPDERKEAQAASKEAT